LTVDEIRAAFIKVAFTKHPDRNPAPDAEEQFKLIGAARALLLKFTVDHKVKGDESWREQAAEAHKSAAERTAEEAQRLRDRIYRDWCDGRNRPPAPTYYEPSWVNFDDDNGFAAAARAVKRGKR
jgi:curved DNA-binding protein CbpA